MKNFLTLILCWLLAFSAIAETTVKIKTAQTVAGGYVTSLNKVDGSFEDGLGGFTASTGTLTQVVSTAMQGEKLAQWVTTASGTVDSPAQTITATNTYEFSAQLNTTDYATTYICAVVNTVEDGCKLVKTNINNQKVSWAGNLNTNDTIKLRVKYTGSNATIKIDDAKLEPWTPQVTNVVEQESYRIRQVGSALLDRNSDIRFNLATASINSSLKNIIKVEDDSDNSRTKITALKKCTLSLSAKLPISSGGQFAYFYKYPSATAFGAGNTVFAANQYSIASGQIELSAGDFVTLIAGADVSNTGDSAEMTFTATAISSNVVQSWQDGMSTWSATSTIQIGATTTAPTKGTTDLDQVRFMKGYGSEYEFWYQYSQTGAGSAGSGDYLFTLPNGLQFDDSVVKYTTVEGTGGWTTGKVGISAGTGWNGGTANYAMFIFPYDSTRFRVAYIGASDASQTGSGVVSSGSAFNMAGVPHSYSLKFSAPLKGMSSTPTLLALPTSKENSFSARIQNNGTASISSQSSNWISSVVRNSPGNVTINFNLGLTVIPSVQLSQETTPFTSPRITSVSTNSIVVDTVNSAGSSLDYPFTVLIQKQSPDYQAPGVFVGNVQPDWQYDLTVTGNNGWSTVRAVGVVYKMASGQYRMRFNIMGNQTSITSNTLSVSGVTFKAITGGYQAVAHANGGASYTSARCESNSSSISIYSSVSAGSATVSGDVELESKPTWAVNTP